MLVAWPGRGAEGHLGILYSEFHYLLLAPEPCPLWSLIPPSPELAEGEDSVYFLSISLSAKPPAFTFCPPEVCRNLFPDSLCFCVFITFFINERGGAEVSACLSPSS